MNGQEVIATTGALPAKVHIHKWPKSERPREKLLERGPHALSDAELLAVLLRCGTRGRNAIELAQEHILAFGSLRELLTAVAVYAAGGRKALAALSGERHGAGARLLLEQLGPAGR